MTGKLLIGLGGYLVAKHYYDVLQLSESERHLVDVYASWDLARSLAGKVVKSPESATLYLLWNKGSRVIYDSYEAYVKDGQKEIVIVPKAKLDMMPLKTDAKITVNGWVQAEITIE